MTRSETAALFLHKARQNLEAARLLLDARLHDATANRAYYASFHALTAALHAAGLKPFASEPCWSHAALQGTLHEVTDRRKLYPSRWKAWLPVSRRIRDVADYRLAEVSSRQARQALAWAAEVVEAVETRLEFQP